jgi:paraquat-inducible protein B
MMQQENTYVGIGLFIFGAVLLVILGGLFFYSEYQHGKKETYVMLFRGSLTGLDSNSPVTYRGVTIGKVKRIELTTNNSNSTVAIPVYVEFFIEKSFVQQRNPIQILINKNIVAEITSPNLLTGTAAIELVPAGPKQVPFKVKTFHGYLRFPTDSTISDDVKANDTFKTLRTTLEDISHFIKSKDLKDTLSSMTNMANSVNTLSVNMDKQVPKAVGYLDNGIFYFKEGVQQFRESLQEFSKAAYSVRTLTDYLSRHPESLLRGK